MNWNMLVSLQLLLQLSGLIAASLYPGKDVYCYVGCQDALGYVQFAGPPEATEDNYYAVQCENVLRVQSTFLCVRKYCTAHEVDAGWKYTSGECEDNGSQLPGLSIVDNYTLEDINRLTTLSYDEYLLMDEELVNSTLIPTAELAKHARRSAVRSLL